MDDYNLLDSRFQFVGGLLALDLVNTEVVMRGKPHDLLATPDDLADWWTDVLRIRGDVQYAGMPYFDGGLLEMVKQLRGALRRIFTSIIEDRTPDEADLRLLNRVLESGFLAVRPDAAGHLAAAYETQGGDEGRFLLEIALSAFRLLTEYERERLHKCGNPRCVMLFYDATKSATRRWCSTACMNRMRSSLRYAVEKEQKA
jgi:predicted RNA-binding Zn ribbon-like protein